MTGAGEVPAVAYLRTDLVGQELGLNEHRMKRLSVRFGYVLRETIRVDASRSRRLVYLEERIGVHAAEAVFVPALVHLEGQVERIVARADVIERDGSTYARWSPIAVLLGDVLLTAAANGSRRLSRD